MFRRGLLFLVRRASAPREVGRRRGVMALVREGSMVGGRGGEFHVC